MMRLTPKAPRRAFHSAPGRENSRRTEEYALVKAKLAQRTDLAVLLSREDLIAAVWVPKKRLAIHSRSAAEHAPLKSDVSLSVDLDFALEHKLV